MIPKTRKAVRSIILSDDTMLSILKRPRIKRAFPFLRKNANKLKGGGCRCGAAKRRKERGAVLARMRNHIVSLVPTLQAKLKRLLKVDQIIVWLPPKSSGEKPERRVL